MKALIIIQHRQVKIMGLAYDKLVSIIKSSIDSAYIPDIVEGTVVDDNPITVEIDKNSPLLDVDFLIIPEHLLEHDVDVEYEGEFDLTQSSIQASIGGESGTLNISAPFNGKFKGKLTVKGNLKVGDPVLMMRCLNGQRYLVLDRI